MRLAEWINEEVALIRRYDPAMTAECEAEYREALGKTLHAAQLRVADQADELAMIAYGSTRSLGSRVLVSLQEASGRARDRALRDWFRS